MEGRGKSASAHTRGEATSFGFKSPSVNQQNYNKTHIVPEKKDTSLESVVSNQTTARSGKLLNKNVIYNDCILFCYLLYFQ